jgi:predicted nucleotidyltransferase
MTREETIKTEIKKAVLSEKNNLAGFTVFFFGSRVSGTFHDRSDFDVGITGNFNINVHTFFRLEEKLDSIDTLYKIDLVNFSHVSDEFQNEAMKNMEVIIG